MTSMTLWGFDGSTYVRTVKMILSEKGFSDYEQVPLNVLEGEPQEPDHLIVIRLARCHCWIMAICAFWRRRRSVDI